DGVNWVVVGVGSKPFEYKADKGIFAIIDLSQMDCLLIIIRNKKVKITVNPSIPSIKADNKELLNIYGNIGTYALLKFDKKIN
ncbi:MAG: hypothetical protein ACFFDK_16795, partial [Promethearchaeota archaeon]